MMLRSAWLLGGFTALLACQSPDSDAQECSCPDLAPVATSGSYGDLRDAPDLTVYSQRADLATVATSGRFSDLSGAPDLSIYPQTASLAPVALSGDYADLTGAPNLGSLARRADLATVATTGAYSDLTGAPTLSAVAATGAYADLSDAPDVSTLARTADLATVATTGAYSDLAGAPNLDTLARAADLAPVATTGAYTDLTGAPWTAGASKLTTDRWVGVGTDTPTGPLAVDVPGLGPEEVDQTSPHDGTLFNDVTSAWQSFTCGVSGMMTALMVHPWWTNPETGYTLTIYAGEGVAGTVVATFTDLYINPGHGPDTYKIVLPSPVNLTAGQVYTWALSNTQTFRLTGYPWATYERGTSDYAPGTDYQFATYMRSTSGHNPALTVASSGRVGVGTASPTAALDVAGDSVRVRASRTPASADACQPGEIAWDANYVYVCVAASSWKRSPLAAY